MGKQELDNLVKVGNLKIEAVSRKEFIGMLESARTRLADSQNESLASDSRSTWRMAQRTGWPSPRFGIGDIVPKIGLQFSRRSSIH